MSSGGGGLAEKNSSSASDCGVVVNNRLQNPPDPAAGVPATIAQVMSAELYVMQPVRGGKAFVAKLLGASASKGGADGYVRKLTGGGTVTFFQAAADCGMPVTAGMQGEMGAIVLSNGDVLAEELLKSGYLTPDAGPVCGSQHLIGCYEALAEGNTSKPRPNPTRAPAQPTAVPTKKPTQAPRQPTPRPTVAPQPTFNPQPQPTTPQPTAAPQPTSQPTAPPTAQPTTPPPMTIPTPRPIPTIIMRG